MCFMVLTLYGFFHFSSNSSFAVSRNSLTALFTENDKWGNKKVNLRRLIIKCVTNNKYAQMYMSYKGYMIKS